ncbi:unnamed protein product [Pedinophyceae sp. YPF-701]|nr:unnamed protein product [Pedinophyceae sp. YPF-701]CAG9465364.1 unnamed protein product [Pedinophyceae sp. YPF-701]
MEQGNGSPPSPGSAPKGSLLTGGMMRVLSRQDPAKRITEDSDAPSVASSREFLEQQFTLEEIRDADHLPIGDRLAEEMMGRNQYNVTFGEDVNPLAVLVDEDRMINVSDEDWDKLVARQQRRRKKLVELHTSIMKREAERAARAAGTPGDDKCMNMCGMARSKPPRLPRDVSHTGLSAAPAEDSVLGATTPPPVVARGARGSLEAAAEEEANGERTTASRSTETTQGRKHKRSKSEVSMTSSQLENVNEDRLKLNRLAAGHRSMLGLPMVSPSTDFVRYWTLLILVVDSVYSAFIVPITVAFDLNPASWSWASVCDFVAGVIFIANLIIQFSIGWVVTNKLRRKLVMNGRDSGQFYILRGTFLIDFLAILPFLLQLTLIVWGTSRLNVSWVNALRLFRLFRLVKHFVAVFSAATSVSQHPSVLQTILPIQLTPSTTYMIQLAYLYFVIINISGMALFYTAARQGLENSWVAVHSDVDLHTVSHYIISVYWALTTMSTIGFGEFYPTTDAERVVTMCIESLGVVLFASVLGSITARLQRMGKEAMLRDEFRSKMAAMDAWMKSGGLPAALKDRVRAYYLDVWGKRVGAPSEAEFLENLPHAVRVEAAVHLTYDTLAELDIFKGLHSMSMRAICGKLVPVSVAPGIDVAAEGDDADSVYVLQAGKAVVVHQDNIVEVLEGPATLGESAFLQHIIPAYARRPRGFRTVDSYCKVWELKLKALQPLFEGSPSVQATVIRNTTTHLCARLAAHPDYADELVQLQQSQAATRRELMQLRKHSTLKEMRLLELKKTSRQRMSTFGLQDVVEEQGGGDADAEQARGSLKREDSSVKQLLDVSTSEEPASLRTGEGRKAVNSQLPATSLRSIPFHRKALRRTGSKPDAPPTETSEPGSEAQTASRRWAQLGSSRRRGAGTRASHASEATPGRAARGDGSDTGVSGPGDGPAREGLGASDGAGRRQQHEEGAVGEGDAASARSAFSSDQGGARI